MHIASSCVVTKSLAATGYSSSNAWANTDQSTLDWIFHNQTEIWVDLYSGGGDTAAIIDVTGDQTWKAGHLVILTVIASCCMLPIFRDSMAIIVGRRCLMITFTVDFKWSEIEAELYPRRCGPHLFARAQGFQN
jgi:hypothetical protein